MHETIRLANAGLELQIIPADGIVRLINSSTGSAWVLDPSTMLADSSSQSTPLFGPADVKHLPGWYSIDTNKSFPLVIEQVEKLGSNGILLTLRGSGGTLVTRWELRPDGLEITALAGISTVQACTLPGAFRPASGHAAAVVPICQGVYFKNTGAPFSTNIARNGHTGWSMPFTALVGERDALVQILVSEHDARLWFERTAHGDLNAVWIADSSRRALRYNRTVLLKFSSPTPAAAALTYREYIKQTGHLKTWAEKIAERPNLERLFGAVMCFIGYCRDDKIDYAASFRKLKAMGVDKAFVYPLSIANLVESFKMGGRDPIDIRQHLGLLHELGYLASSWMWVEDIPDTSLDNLLLGIDGKPVFSWQIEAIKWYKSCPVRGVMLANKIQNERMAGHTAQHFDVTASRNGLECYHPDHPLDRSDDALWRRRILETACARGNVVSSEGFWGYATPSYDIGSVKIPVALHGDWFTIPLTSLVYHDSCIHDWWEVDNYNNSHHRTQGGRGTGLFPMGGGWLEQQSLQDALAGWPPNVMPFGAQYQYVDGKAPETELYRFELDMPSVTSALKVAIPVARLHGQVGKVACIDHQILAADGAVQSTTFADGTSVFANFGMTPVELPTAGLLESQTWKSVRS